MTDTLQYEFDLAIFIGRLQPYHLAHHAMVQRALSIAQNAAVVLGSSHRARDPKNPFRWEERRDMVQLSVSDEDRERLGFIPMRDYYDDESWVRAVREEVARLYPQARRIALVGHFKDASSYYLNRFPGWQLVEQEIALEGGLSATQIRDYLFSSEASWPVVRQMLKPLLPQAVLEYLGLWRSQPCFANLCEEQQGLLDGKARWAGTPYEVLFITVDAIVRCNDHVLLIRRGRSPGKGLWAVPGGFLEANETLRQSAARELAEETCLDVRGYNLDYALREVKVFDHPQRSLRGRTVTHAHYYDLGDRRQLPEVRAADDAAAGSATWVPLSELPSMEESFFEDHYSLLAAMPQRGAPATRSQPPK